VKRFWAWLCVPSFVLACATSPRPRVLGEVDAIRQGAAAQQAEKLAPQAHARAEALRKLAENAHDDGKLARAQALGEHALAAYGHAFVLSRLVRAQRRQDRARQNVEAARSELHALDQQQRTLAAETDALELRIKVARDAVPLRPNVPSSPEREKARREAAEGLTVQARLLCSAAKLLEPTREGLPKLLAELSTVEQRARSEAAAPIDEALRLRSECLKQLTLTRRPARRSAPAAGVADALLSELSEGGDLFPFRDDRGVVVTLRSLFDARGKLTGTAEKTLDRLGLVAKAHPEFPVLVVVHAARGRPTDADAKRAQAVAERLRRSGATRVEPHVAGGAQPVLDPKRPGATERNRRVEIVFVAPA